MAKKKQLKKKQTRPRILIVTPEITYLPEGMGNLAQRMSAKAGGMADVSATLVSELYDQDADVHVALPNYRRMFHIDVKSFFESQHSKYLDALGEQSIHLAEDRIFYHRDKVYSAAENNLIALAFQREVINNIIPRVQPDLIHCNDWMTGLIPAAAKRLGIPCLYTIHNIHSERLLLSEIEDRGIDAADFWHHLYYDNPPGNYEYARDNNPVDLLASGIFASDYINSVSETFLYEVAEGRHHFVPESIRSELAGKLYSGNAEGILNAPDPAHDPETDEHLIANFGVEDHIEGKRANKIEFQKRTGLNVDPNAPLFFWPSRLDPVQKGCQLLAEILHNFILEHEDKNAQIAIIANGQFQVHFLNIVELHNIRHRVCVIDFNEELSHQGYAAADFMLMPSFFEPCGLPQMIAPKYGTIPVVHDTGGIHDTVENLNYEKTQGNGFSFQYYNTEGLYWAMNEAIYFYQQPAEFKEQVIKRIMEEANSRFNHENTAAAYIRIYEKILGKSVSGK